MKKVKVAAYCRVSTNKKDQNNSFENQKTYFEREVRNNDEYELYAIYSDKGLSGTNFNKRLQFTTMLYDAGLDTRNIGEKVVFYPSLREPKFKRILVSNSSRFARNVEVISILRDLRKKGVFVDFLDIGKSSEHEEDEFIITFFLNFDQQHSIDKSKKVRFGHLESARQGKIFCNHSLYGYSYHPDTNELEVIPEEAEVIKKIFEMYSQGYGVRKIVDKFGEQGLKTRSGKFFERSTIRKILDNEKYCGVLVRNKYDTGTVFNKNISPKKKPKSEWLVHEGKVPAIISKELFDQCQEILLSKAGEQRGIYRGKGEFAGLIVCGGCGSTYTRNTDKGRLFYNCGLKKNKGTKACNNVNLQQGYLEEALEVLEKGMLYEGFLYDQYEKLQLLSDFRDRLINQLDQDKSEEVKELSLQLSKLQESKNRLLDLYLDTGGFEKEELDSRRDSIDMKISNLKEKIREQSKGNDEIYLEINEIEVQREALSSLEIKKYYTREEIINLLKCITVTRNEHENDKAHITFEFKVFDLINRLVDKYIDKGKKTESTLRFIHDKTLENYHLDYVTQG